MGAKAARPLAALVPLLLLAACYRYVPTSLETAPPGRTVRVELTDEGVRQVAELFGTATRSIQGEVARLEPPALVLTGLHLFREGAGPGWSERRVRLAPADVDLLEIQTFDGRRTALLAALVGAAVGASFYFATVEDPGKEPGSGSPDREFLVLPLGR